MVEGEPLTVEVLRENLGFFGIRHWSISADHFIHFNVFELATSPKVKTLMRTFNAFF